MVDELNIYENSEIVSLTKDNATRIEMMWNNKIEYLFEDWAAQSKEFAQQHNIIAKKKKCLYRSFGLPAMIIPIAMSSLNQIYENDTETAIIINSICFLLTGTLTGINTFLNFASQYEKHYYSEVRYKELYIDIQSLLIKPKKDRPPADVSIERYKLKFEHINENSPDI